MECRVLIALIRKHPKKLWTIPLGLSRLLQSLLKILTP